MGYAAALMRASPWRPSPLAEEIFPWLDEFEAGMINDPALVDGTLPPDERVAVRAGPLAAVDLRPQGQDAAVGSVGLTGTLLATNQRAIIQASSGPAREWWWARDVNGLRFLPHSAGAAFLPTKARFEEGVRVQGIVAPWYAHGDPPPGPDRDLILTWWKLEGAWRASQPGGLVAWRQELTELLSR